jgi:VanZ family protein
MASPVHPARHRLHRHRRQSFLPDRTGSPLDVLLDTAGACALCLLVWFLCWRRRQSHTELIAA